MSSVEQEPLSRQSASTDLQAGARMLSRRPLVHAVVWFANRLVDTKPRAGTGLSFCVTAQENGLFVDSSYSDGRGDRVRTEVTIEYLHDGPFTEPRITAERIVVHADETRKDFVGNFDSQTPERNTLPGAFIVSTLARVWFDGN